VVDIYLFAVRGLLDKSIRFSGSRLMFMLQAGLF
jgi:hypothetical protein